LGLFWFLFSVGAATTVWVCFLVEGCQLVGCGCEREREREGHWGRGGGRGLFYILKQASFGFLFEGLGGEREEI